MPSPLRVTSWNGVALESAMITLRFDWFWPSAAFSSAVAVPDMRTSWVRTRDM